MFWLPTNRLVAHLNIPLCCWEGAPASESYPWQGRPVRLPHRHLVTVPQQCVALLVRARIVHNCVRLRDLRNCLLDGIGEHRWIQAFDSCTQSADQEDFRPVVPTDISVLGLLSVKLDGVRCGRLTLDTLMADSLPQGET